MTIHQINLTLECSWHFEAEDEEDAIKKANKQLDIDAVIERLEKELLPVNGEVYSTIVAEEW